MNTPAPQPRRKPIKPMGEPNETVARLVRIESKIVQLMKHVGMKTDGRAALGKDKG